MLTGHDPELVAGTEIHQTRGLHSLARETILLSTISFFAIVAPVIQ